MKKSWLVITEGIHFLWTFRSRRFWSLFSKEYWVWRLGTVYGQWKKEEDGVVVKKTFRELLLNVWQDRHRVPEFLYWRRQMRRKKLK